MLWRGPLLRPLCNQCQLACLPACLPCALAAADPADSRVVNLVFNNPFLGKAVSMCSVWDQVPKAIGLYHAHGDLTRAAQGSLSIRSSGGALDLLYHPAEDEEGGPLYAEYSAAIGYDRSLAMAIARVKGKVKPLAIQQ